MALENKEKVTDCMKSKVKIFAPAISVVMPVHNSSNFLRKSIESVISQEFGDFEFIIVDYGSSDGSVDIIRSYDDERIRTILKINSRIEALNTAIGMAKGKYIAYVDAQGKMPSDRLAVQYAFMETNKNIDISTGWTEFAGEDGSMEKIPPEHNGIAYSLIYGNRMIFPAAMFKKSIFKRKRLKYKQYSPAEDYKMWTDMIDAGFRFASLQQPLNIYEKSGSLQITRSRTNESEYVETKIKLEYLNRIIERIASDDERYVNLMNSLVEATNNNLINTANMTEFIENIYMDFLKKESLMIKHKRIMNFLKKRYLYIIDKYKNATTKYKRSKIENTSPIWVCWWQGEDKEPDIVKSCIKSIYHNSGEHPVHIITKHNYTEYINIPDYIIEKAECGIISLTFLSDILRVNLLYEFGGYWIDATVLMTGPLPEEKKTDFFSIRTLPDLMFVANGRWASYLLGCGKHCLLFDFTRTFLHEYLKKENVVLDYFLIDYIFALAYDIILDIKRMIDRNKCYIPCIYKMEAMLNVPFSASIFDGICSHAHFHKLSWKRRYEKMTENGELTIYGYLVNREFDNYYIHNTGYEVADIL